MTPYLISADFVQAANSIAQCLSLRCFRTPSEVGERQLLHTNMIAQRCHV